MFVVIIWVIWGYLSLRDLCFRILFWVCAGGCLSCGLSACGLWFALAVLVCGWTVGWMDGFAVVNSVEHLLFVVVCFWLLVDCVVSLLRVLGFCC